MTKFCANHSLVRFSFSFAVTIFLVGFNSASLARPPKSTRPPPNDPVAPGGGLDPDKSCGSPEKLVSLIPRKSPTRTVSNYPQLYFYIPYRSENLRVSEFSIHEWNGGGREKELYRGTSIMAKRPGIMSLNWLGRQSAALEEGKIYHWYLELYCKDNRTSIPSLSVSGYIERVGLTTTVQRQIDSYDPDFWHDVLTKAASTKATSSSGEQWEKLLISIDHQELTSRSISGSIELP
jgi:hypothetical protein